jgi:hypothetical protein
VVAAVSFVFVRTDAGDGHAFMSRQTASTLSASAVNRVVKAAPDPVAEPTHAPGAAADCTPRGSAGLLNPWRCTIIYPSGRRVTYRVTIRAGGSYTGGSEVVAFRGRTHSDTGTITGCCIEVP